MLLPIIMIVICFVGGGVAYFFIKQNEKNKYKAKSTPQVTGNEFTNVKDIHGNFLYTRDGLMLCYLKLMGCGCGVSGLAYNFVVTGNHSRVELWINKGTQEYNKQIFDSLFKRKEKLEAKFGTEFEWERLDSNKGSRVAYYLRNVSIFNEDDWDSMVDFMVESMIKLDITMRDELKSVIPNR